MGKRNHKNRGAAVSDENPWERAFATLEAKDRPENYPGLTSVTRRRASTAQFMSFSREHAYDWRHTKLRLYLYFMSQREHFLEENRARLEKSEEDPEIAVYRDMTNGIAAAAVSEFCQYAEDLAGLATASRSGDFFVRDLIEADAGKMQNRVKSWKGIDTRAAADLLHIPWFEPNGEWQQPDVGVLYLRALETARDRLREIGTTYLLWERYYMRYKHGLLLALKSGGSFEKGSKRDEFIAEAKTTTRGLPLAYESGRLRDELNKPGLGLMLPDVGPDSADVVWNVRGLAAERNLLRHVIPPESPDVKDFERVGSYIAQAQIVLIENRRQELRPDAECSYYMPAEDPAGRLHFGRRGGPP